MRSANRIRARIENLEWVLMRLKTTSGFFNNHKDLILTTKKSIEELNWVLGKPKKKQVEK